MPDIDTLFGYDLSPDRDTMFGYDLSPDCQWMN